MSQTTTPSGCPKYDLVVRVCHCYAFVNYILPIPRIKMETTHAFCSIYSHKEITNSHGPTVITKWLLILHVHTNTTIVNGYGEISLSKYQNEKWHLHIWHAIGSCHMYTHTISKFIVPTCRQVFLSHTSQHRHISSTLPPLRLILPSRLNSRHVDIPCEVVHLCTQRATPVMQRILERQPRGKCKGKTIRIAKAL